MTPSTHATCKRLPVVWRAGTRWLAGLLVMSLAGSAASGDDKPSKRVVVAPVAQAMLKTYCSHCHGSQGKGGINLSELESLEVREQLDLLNKVQDQLFYRMMPPAKSEQLNEKDRVALSGWVRSELQRHNASKLDERLSDPSSGNYVDHALLFSGTIKDKAYTPARRWLVSPQIYDERVRDSLHLEGKQRTAHLGVLNPFLLPERSGVRDYDLTPLDGGHFVVMQNNAAWLASRVIVSLRIKTGDIEKQPNEKFLLPTTLGDKAKTPTMPAFERIVAKKTPPSDEELTAAIRFQFERVLHRPPTDSEKAKYLKFTHEAIEAGGNLAGLKKLLETVWMESEFVYRLEFGAGTPDQYGRKLLAPREASYAIAYALGDKAPDAVLLKAALEGRLATKVDFEREVRRLLADTTHLSGPIDPLLSNSGESTHPKIVRFFREFFGYPMAMGVFKDIERSNGFYHNPDHKHTQTPGHLIHEADLVVDAIVREDKRVFETLLTTDKFFVAPVENAAAKMKALNEVYDRFKDAKWQLKPGTKKAPSWLSAEDLEFLRKRIHPAANEVTLNLVMRHVEHYRKKGLDPHPQWSYAYGELRMLAPHANSYNIAPPDWAYPQRQPFEVQHRKGILTHPAWLIAHSLNSSTDPVRRGKWVREKLLAGVVPDVPITVDAVIPEDPTKTLRQRLDHATERQACAKCHHLMNPLGLTFEIFDDFGRYRTQESLEHPDNIVAKAKVKYGADTYKTAPVVATGRLDGTGDPKLDGEVKDALDLIDRIAKSERVRQSIIRHAFRFFLGRNELLSDSQTLIDADRAYVQSGGSFKAVIVSLLTSDSFLYRK
ncbi:MAG: DUF1588 domain-containing protein [Gemmataceae bacterium]